MISEVTTLLEVNDRVRVLNRIRNDSVGVTDFRGRIRDIVRMIADIIIPSESMNYFKRIFVTNNDTVNVSQFRGRIRVMVRMISESMSSSETLESAIGKVIIISETVNAVHSLVKVLRYGLNRTTRDVGTFARAVDVKLFKRDETTKGVDR
jgi:uracil phosphoribosyltransferase